MADIQPLHLPEKPGQDMVSNQFGIWRGIGVPIYKIFNSEELITQATNWQQMPDFITLLNQQLAAHLAELGHDWASLSAVNYLTYSLLGLTTLLTHKDTINTSASSLEAIGAYLTNGAAFTKSVNDCASIITPGILLKELNDSDVNIDALSSRGRLFTHHEFSNIKRWETYPRPEDEIDVHLAEVFCQAFLTAVVLEYGRN